MKPEHDPILDAALAEVLGGQTPPDLTARILRAWENRDLSHVNGAKASLEGEIEAPPVMAPPFGDVVVPPPVVAGSLPVVLAKSARKPAWSARYSAASAGGVAALILIAASITVYWNRERAGRAGAMAVNPPARPPVAPVVTPEKVAPSVVAKQPIPAPNVSPVVPAPEKVNSAVAQATPTVEPAAPVTPMPPTTPSPVDEPKLPRPQANEVVSYVNHDLASAWKAAGVKPADAATEAEWCRRLYLRLLGRIPTVDELQQYLADKHKNRRDLVVSKLLDSELYADEFAEHWANRWTNLLIGRTGGTDGNDLASREGLQAYLQESLRRNKPYNELVRELISATGSGKVGAPDFNGAANFLLASLDEDGTLATMRVSRLFLGMNLHCAQCHNHPSLDWTQKDYWSLNACFRQMQAERSEDAAKLVNRDFAGKSGDQDEAEVYFQLPSGLMAAAYPRFLDGTELPRSGKVSVVDRRSRVAELIAKSQWLAPTVVNRMWGHFFGYSFTGPQDDLWGDGQSTHPELVEKLARDFVASGYDLRSLMRWIVLTDAFSRSSKMGPGSLVDAPEAGTAPLFSRYYTRQMQAEEVYESLLVAGNLRRQAGKTGNITQARVQWLSQFNRRMATDDGREESNFDGSFRQALTLMNGDLMQRVVSHEQDGQLRGVITSKLPFEQKLEHLFLAALSRRPTKKEMDAVRQLSKLAGGDEATTLQDVWWGLLNSNEFILDH